MSNDAAGVVLRTGDKELQLPLVESTDGNNDYDVSKLLEETGNVTLDVGFVNTASCFGGFPRDAHPMAVLSSAVSALSTFYQDSLDPFDPEQVEISTVRLMAKLPTIAAYAYKRASASRSSTPTTPSRWSRIFCG